MALYFDVHKGLHLTEHALKSIKNAKEHQTKDKFGVIQRELYYNDQGDVICILEGPDEKAVRDHHHELGVDCQDVLKIDRL